MGFPSLGISREEAKSFIDKYFAVYKGVKRYTQEIIDIAKKTGYVETLFGRKRYLPELNSSVFTIRGAAERMAINMPVQGTAADIMKKAMIQINEELRMKNEKLLLQVHDELVFEVPENEIKKAGREIKNIMEGAFKLSVPLTVDISAGNNWQDMKKM